VKAALKSLWPVIVAAVVLAACWRAFPALQDKLRLWGMVLQLVGLAMVITGILQTRARLGVGLAEAARALLSRFKPGGTVSSAAASATGSSTASFQGTLAPVVYHSTEEHLAALEAAINVVRAEAAAAVRKGASEQAAALDAERRVREESDQAILKRLRDDILSKYPQELLGTALIAIGIITSTAQAEIERLLRSLLPAAF
jgi:hypothetical protein